MGDFSEDFPFTEVVSSESFFGFAAGVLGDFALACFAFFGAGSAFGFATGVLGDLA